MQVKSIVIKTAIAFALVQMLLGCQFSNKPKNVAGEIKASTPELSDYFRYKEGGDIIVSGHRGGRLSGLPENSLEIYQYVAGNMPVIFEIDPRLTKDSVIVVHHDATLDRTTTGTGKLNGYTYQELLDSVKLKDHEGNPTLFNVPMLKDVMVWAKGKTVLNLDKKDVPPAMVVSLIKEMEAEDCMMVTVHNGEQAKYYYEQLPGVMQSVFIRTNEEYESFAGSGVPWHNIIAYVGKTIDENNAELVKKLHDHGVRCMVSFAPTHDKLQDEEIRKQEYQKELLKNPDIIESDLPLEVWAVLQAK